MAIYVYSKSSINVCIPFTEKEDNLILYVIKVEIGEVWWLVKQRYSSFERLHSQLVSNHGLRKDLLPAKKIIGNKDPEFVERRRFDLEVYLKKIVSFLEKALPNEMLSFFEFDQYEVYSLVTKLNWHTMFLKSFSRASELFLKGETKIFSNMGITKNHPLVMNPLQLHAVSRKIQLPRSPIEQLNKEQDFAHVLDFFSNIESLEVKGSRDFHCASNLICNNLPFDLSAFKNLKHLSLIDVNVNSLVCARNLRSSLETLSAHGSGIKCLAEILVCDNVHRNLMNLETKINSPNVWRELIYLNLSKNSITEIHQSILSMVPKLRRLDLSFNSLSTMANLSSLSDLEELNLSNNKIQHIEQLHMKLGNVKKLNLSHNRLTSLDGLSKLYGLVILDVRFNQLKELESVRHVSKLPQLEELTLLGNPCETVLDFRVKVLQMFGTHKPFPTLKCNRAGEICLNNEKAIQKELDTVAVLLALSSAKTQNLK